MKQQTLLISDLHLDPGAPVIARQLLEFLETEARDARALYILGDLFEAWLGDDDPDPAVREIVTALRRLTDGGVPCYFMHGNRDFLVGQRFAAETGCKLLRDGTIVDLHGERVMLMHGDVLCTADTSYQRLRRILRNPSHAVGVPSPESRRTSAARPRSCAPAARCTSAPTAAEIMDVTPAAVIATMQRAGVRR